MDNTTVYINFDNAKEMMTKAMTESLADKLEIAAPEQIKPYKPYAAEIEIPIRLHRTNNRKKRRFINILKAHKSFKRSDTSERV